jgi:hypothetical protein
MAMRGRSSSVKGAGSRSGRESVDTGISSWRRAGVAGFLARLLPRWCFAPAAAAVPAKRWSRPVSVARLTGLPVLRPSSS